MRFNRTSPRSARHNVIIAHKDPEANSTATVLMRFLLTNENWILVEFFIGVFKHMKCIL